MICHRTFQACLAVVYTALTASSAMAQSYPTQPVKIIVGTPAGDNQDATARYLADRFGTYWGQQVLVLNRPGGGGMIAAQEAARAAPDGHTLYMTNFAATVVLPEQHKNASVDPERDLVPIGFVGEAPVLLVVAPALGVATLAEFIAKAKAAPGAINYAASGRGTIPHLSAELIQKRAGISMTFVPFVGSSQSIHEVMAGRLSVMFTNVLPVQGQLESGALRAIAASTSKRLDILPNVPAIAETFPGYEAAAWSAFVAPKGTPDAIVQKVSADLIRILTEPATQARFRQLGTTLRPMNPEQLRAFFADERKRWLPFLKETAVKPR